MTGLARPEYSVAIVGAGVVGLFTACRLAEAGAGPVLVVDRGFLSSGASGRNGGGVRQQWETPATVRLAREAVAEWRRFPQEFGHNIWFRQGGYLFLAHGDADRSRLERVHSVVSAEGLPIRRLDPAGLAAVVPALDPQGVVAATYLGTDGTLYPFPAIWALYERARALGVEVALGVEALGVERAADRVAGLRTSVGSVRTPRVVNAAGGWSGEFSRRAGVPLPNRATRHEILATEPLRPMLDPMVIRLADGLYVSQTMRGELVGGLSLPHPEGTTEGVPTSPEFLRVMAQGLLGLFPRLAGVGVLRAWSGYYDDTDDGFPVIGPDPRLAGFIQANGFGGHGFMLAPATTRRVARATLGEPTDLDPKLFGPGRFVEPGRVVPSEHLQPG